MLTLSSSYIPPGHAIWTFRPDVAAIEIAGMLGGIGAVWPTADLAIYVPIRIKMPIIVVKLHVVCTSSSGNFDVGVYDATGTRKVSSGATASAAPKTVDVTDTLLTPGLHYLALVYDNTTAQVNRNNPAAPIPASQGILTQQLGAGGTLPSSATWAVNQTLAYIPNIGMLFETTVA